MLNSLLYFSVITTHTHTGHVSVHPSKTSVSFIHPLFIRPPPPVLTLHLCLHHLHLNCAHAVSAGNALPSCFWWWFASSRTPSIYCTNSRSPAYLLVLMCLTLCLFIVETWVSLLQMFPSSNILTWNDISYELKCLSQNIGQNQSISFLVCCHTSDIAMCTDVLV